MIFAALLLVAFIIALVIFGFSVAWYSKFLFKDAIFKTLESKLTIKKNLLIEFLSSLLLSLAIVVIFAPFNFYFGLINGALLCFGILLPIAISIANWSEDSLKLAVIKTAHRFFQIIIAFVLTGLLNQLMMPYFINMME
jgi:hypothetical protein